MIIETLFSGFLAFAATDDRWLALHARTHETNLPRVELSLPGIARFNESINHTVRYSDADLHHWQTPRETLAAKTCACMDYAVLKYFALVDSGVAENDLHIVIGMTPQGPHAMLAVELDHRLYALDNRFDRVVPLSDYVNFMPIEGFSGTTVVRFGRALSLGAKR